MRDIFNALYMLGMLFGSYFFGWFSDNFGRVNALMLAVVTLSLSGFFGCVPFICILNYCKFLTPKHKYFSVHFVVVLGEQQDLEF